MYFMNNGTKIADYILYMAYLNKKLGKFFDDQKPYISCKRGCSKCCENGEYPFSELEHEFLMIGFSKLKPDIQKKIVNKISEIKRAKENSDGVFTYECPFLINHECSVYDFRGIICRSFGLMSINPNGKTKIPFCAFENLNYSNVVDEETKIISLKKYQKLGKDVPEPLAYNVSYGFLTSENIEKSFHLNFGEKKSLIEWF